MDLKLIAKFFRKECTPEEALRVMDWFRSQEVQKGQEDDLFQIWEEVEREKHDVQFSHNPEEWLASIHQQIKEKSGSHRTVSQNRNISRNLFPRVLKGAAVLFMAVLLGWIFRDIIPDKQAGMVPEVVYLEAPSGIKLTKVLPDGSKVTLNSRSSITYTEGFGETKRELTLRGEGFFEVVKDPLRPFTVHAGNTATTALGTSFNIKNNSSTASTAISLATGNVQVKIAAKEGMKSAELEPGEMIKYSSYMDTIEMGRFDLQETLSWKNGILYFNKTNLDQVVQRLEDWYGVQITLDGIPGQAIEQDWTYTGRFENQSLENVLTGISFVKDFDFEIEGKNIKLIFNQN